MVQNGGFRAESGTTFQADQSRLIVDYREPAGKGALRAYIEADFSGGDDDGFLHLRHAYGQYNVLLVGKTWSSFTDARAVPEDIDFEGLNARIRIRQTQIRYFPRIGRKHHMVVAMEASVADVSGGSSATEYPDFVASINREVGWGHVQLALLMRQIRAQSDSIPEITSAVPGVGVSVSGQVPLGLWGNEDNLQFQLNVGQGIGRYINNLGEAGG